MGQDAIDNSRLEAEEVSDIAVKDQSGSVEYETHRTIGTQAYRSSELTISHNTSCLVLSLVLKFMTNSSWLISLQLCLTSQYRLAASDVGSVGNRDRGRGRGRL